jgi:uncharacterized protein YbjT (DUF2867 family)
MRVLVSGAGGFVGAHVDAELERVGHQRIDLATADIIRRAWREDIDAVIHLAPDDVRTAIDVAHLTRAKRFVLLSSLGADSRSPHHHFRARGHAEELVRAGGIPWVILRAEILWGPGDLFTNELARLLRHLPVVPIPKTGPVLEPVYAGDAARSLVEMAAGALTGLEQALVGPERLEYAEIVERVASALGLEGRRRVKTSAWMVRMGTALEERIARRPRVTRALLDRLVAHRDVPDVAPDEARQPMTIEALRSYLIMERSPARQLASVSQGPSA